jgi:hypothetical protein
MTKSNPFYALSACAMLLGCFLLGEALHLQAGTVGSLLLLMGVLQLYEALLVGLGLLLVRTGRAPRDGTSVLLLETLFLMDAPLLAAECVTADARVGTAAALALLGLASAKLAWVRRAAPGLLSRPAALLLGAHAAFVLALPAAAAHLAAARLLSPQVLWLFWSAGLALPLAAWWLHAQTGPGGASSRALAAWAGLPAAMVLLHLWAVGYIHAVPFQPAFLAPLVLGLVLVGPRGHVAWQVAPPAFAILASLRQGAELGFSLPGAGDVSPLRVALLAAATAWAWLAWRDRARGLALLAAGTGAASVLGPHGPSLLAEALGRVVRLLDRARPRDAFGWGVLSVVAAFVLLVAGARRSLWGPPEPPAPRAPRTPAAAGAVPSRVLGPTPLFLALLLPFVAAALTPHGGCALLR